MKGSDKADSSGANKLYLKQELGLGELNQKNSALKVEIFRMNKLLIEKHKELQELLESKGHVDEIITQDMTLADTPKVAGDSKVGSELKK